MLLLASAPRFVRFSKSSFLNLHWKRRLKKSGSASSRISLLALPVRCSSSPSTLCSSWHRRLDLLGS
ncbi:hypothetical protein D0U04_21820 [Bacillus clarus]|uniref:Uncharacterized protein n=1 Tax=Bacillus clarus TaxID=2338372 RepID=A0ABX9KQI6_9BACI|nr:hypothetical protein D0U04_21820 [Bacillus clarus]